MGHWPKLGLHGKNQILGPKKKLTSQDSPCCGHDRIGLIKEKACLCSNNYHPKYHFGWFLGVKPIFRPKTTFRQNVKPAISPKFRPGPGPWSFWVIFLMAQTVSPSFVEISPKVRVLMPVSWHKPKMSKSRGEPRKMTPSSKMEFFLGVVPMGKL